MSASTEFDFRIARNDFGQVLQSLLTKNLLSQCIPHVQSYHGNDSEKKLALDQALRDIVRIVITEEMGCSVYREVITAAIEAANQDVCSASTPFVLLSDVFDMIILEQCEDIFNLVEEKVSTWKSDTFYDAGKNYLLRMCNDLLRRLSKSQNTVFCGRIQLFLSRLFPLSEKSALNLMSQFNLDNITVYNTNREESRLKNEVNEDRMEFDGEMEENNSNVPIDFNLYRKFWALQDFFRKPLLCYEKVAWLTFTSNANEVLTAFSSYKLDDMKSPRKKLNRSYLKETQTYFAKYLTSEKLLDLQLSDSNFRRYVLVQFLILVQYLNAPVKFKNANCVLSEEQNVWIKTTEEWVYQLLKETPPDGETFAKSILHILRREENWNAWKNEGCPLFERHGSAGDIRPKTKVKRKSVGSDLIASGGKLIKMGSPELTRLWNLCPDNTEACKSEKRVFLPTLEDFFADAIEQSDPEAMVEDEYKLVKDQVFQWKALRLLARRSPHFFTHAPQPAVELPVYLESMVTRLAKEMPPPHEEMKTEIGEEEDIKAPSPDDGEEIKNDGTDIPSSTWKFNNDFLQGGSTDDLPINKHQIHDVAEGLGHDWKKLAVELNFSDDVIAEFDSESHDVSQKALKMLTSWFETEAEHATPGCLRTALNEIGLLEVADQVFPDIEASN
ncbi:THO complex subunit 1 [Octopus bimaculoides]|uniref:THO complex subunit 1 n=1 Tax=Octopus bimaculoides TaxID=37653 RepID=UPI00071E2632|nr:THO complex subunit 1 [Octopus bimaculoides]|eukprot:XP_014782757.1 PREDICTED: THO complex subunit 1-like isoform X2 [Octopus bimaculoides]